MRDVFCRSLVNNCGHPKFVFMTGDLGFKVLEPLRDAAGSRFLNVGVAEQNMISVAAGLAKTGLRPWAYSIAPFLYARPFEQIRNDICLPDLPVMLVGNGGGYAYGVMGSTHHALEDYGALLTLPNIRAFIPAFDADVAAIVNHLIDFPHPAYLRLGLSEQPNYFTPPSYSAWRHLLPGTAATVLVTGPLAGGLVAASMNRTETDRPSLWLVSEIPLMNVPAEFLDDLKRSRHLVVVEEHVEQGSLGRMIVHYLASHGVAIPRFTHHCAKGYVSGLYGSQKFHRQECGLDAASILAHLSS
ncbi:MAG: transketolase [Bryobacteraceae bacterium]